MSAIKPQLPSKRVTYVEFTRPVAIDGAGIAGPVSRFRPGEPMKEFMGGKEVIGPEVTLEGEFLVIGKRRFSVHGTIVHSFDLE